MQQNFATSLSFVLGVEGGFSDDPHDPGGATNHGITQATFDAWLRAHGDASRDVRTITSDEVSAIYRTQYWDAVRGDDLGTGLDLVVFDEAVNSGPIRAIKDLQTVLGVVSDGHFGVVTLSAAKQVAGTKGTINRLCDLRLGWLHRLRTWQWFSKGWTNRIERTRAAALKMVS